MANSSMMHQHVFQPFAYFGLHHSFFNIQADTLISTWAVIGIITIISIVINRSLKMKIAQYDLQHSYTYEHSKI